MEKETKKTEIYPTRPNWLWIPAMGEDGLIGGADSAFQEARDYITWLESTDNGQVLAKLVELQDVCYTLLGIEENLTELENRVTKTEETIKNAIGWIECYGQIPRSAIRCGVSNPMYPDVTCDLCQGHNGPHSGDAHYGLGPNDIFEWEKKSAPQSKMPNCTKPDGMTLEKCHAFNSGKCMSEFQCKPTLASTIEQTCPHGHPHWEHCSFCEKEQAPAPRCPICGQELRWNGNLGYFFCGCLGFECCIVRLKPYETEEAAPVLAPNDIICHWNSFSADPAELCVMGWDESYRSLKCPDCKLPTCNNCFAHEDNAPHGCMGGGVCGLWSLYKE